VPKRSQKRSRNCPVKAISGIKTNDCRPRLYVLGDGLEIDLRLAGAGDPINQGC